MTNNKKIYTAQELLDMKITKMPCLVDPIFPKTGLVAVVGSSDAGKSSLMRQLCIAISSGATKFIGYDVQAAHQRAIYISTEDGSYQVSFLLGNQNRGLNLPEEKFGGLSYIFNTESLLECLKERLDKEPHDLIVIDAFSDVFGRDINQTNQVRTFLNDFSNLAEKYQCLIAFVHHTGKASENKSPNKNSILGSQGFEAKMRTVVMLSKDKVLQGKRYFSIVKGNYLRESNKKEAIQLAFDQYQLFTPTGNTILQEDLVCDENKKLQREKTLELHEKGLKQKEIADQLGISQPQVSRIISDSRKDNP